MGVLSLPIIESAAAAPVATVNAVVLTANQSTTNTTGTGDATLLALPVVAGKRYLVRLRLIGNGLRGTFVCPPSSGNANLISTFTASGSGDGFDANASALGTITNINTPSTRTFINNGNLAATSWTAAIGPAYVRGRFRCQTSGTLTFHIGGTAGTLYAGSTMELEEVQDVAGAEPATTGISLTGVDTLPATVGSINGRDTALVLPVEASKIYLVRAFLFGNNGNGIKYALMCPAGSTIAGFMSYNHSSTHSRQEITAINTFGTLTMTTNGALCEIWARLKTSTTAGNVTVKFGSTIDNTQSHLYAGSTLTCHEIDGGEL